ncbi:magnesium/cobalt transporter CorA [Myxococcota bacterium]|nr:magnesium/cobalt transporter CorA [Myxococcota bacterium]MBU1381767.1 magnesium/cobalt transporter CorA [Myxococcota bacterium]MBU1496527.1 magnesium/cobalt transporter CorA [Myxococcota bacterium]
MTLKIRRNKKFGLPPGSLIYTGIQPTESVHIIVYRYSEKQFEEKRISDIRNLARDEQSTDWVFIEGVHDRDLLLELGQCYNINNLILEDIMNISQRSKFEEYDDLMYMVFPVLERAEDKLIKYNINIIVKNNTVITLCQKFDPDLWNPLISRIRDPEKKIRKSDSHFLLYSITDLIVDHYVELAGEMDEKLFTLRQETITAQDPFEKILDIQNELLFLRRAFSGCRETMSALLNHPSSGESNYRYFLRDCFDHLISCIESVDFNFHNTDGLVNLHFSRLNQKMNEIIKFLTLISTLFIPASFIVGFYGMNFKHMPELSWKWGYPAVIALIISVVGGLLVLFSRRKWV